MGNCRRSAEHAVHCSDTQCAQCKDVKRSDDCWMPVVALIAEPHEVSHGLCPRCIAMAYAEFDLWRPLTQARTLRFMVDGNLAMARKLIEQDEVALLFGNLGTGPNSAIVRYVNQIGVPHLFLSVNGDKWTDYKTNPWSMPFAPSGRVECQVAIKHTLHDKPNAKFAILYQNDDFGRDYIAGAKAKPGALAYGTSGIGSSGHLAGELLGYMAGIKMTHVPYKGGSPGLMATLSGEVGAT